jgi:hypothetical protein
MNPRYFGLALALVALALPALAGAHHSTAMFERDARVTLTGVIKEFQWTNPHSWIQVVAPGPDGKPTEWSVECSSPNTLSRQGWKPSTFKPGDKVVVVVNPMKDGTHAGLLIAVTLADGRVLGPGAEQSASPASPAAR